MITVSLNPVELDKELDPKNISYTNQFYILENLNRRLVSIDENGIHRLDLASKVNKVSDIEYHFEIYKSYYSNGELITLDNVVQSIVRTWGSGSTHTSLDLILSSVYAKDKTLIIKLKKPSKSLFYYLSLPDMSILHPSQLVKTSLTAEDFVPVTSGPYSYFKDTTGTYLVKNKYYNFSHNAPDKVRLISPFGKDIAEMFLSNQIDLGQVDYQTFFKNRDKIILNKDIKHLGVPSDALTYICFNKNSKKYANITERKKISDSIQKNFKVDPKYSELARRTYQYFPPESKAYIEGLRPFDDIVSDTLKEKIPLKIYTYTTAYKVTIEALLNSLKINPDYDISIINDVEPAEYTKRMNKGDIDLFLAITGTDFRMPVEAINFEYLSPEARFVDEAGKIRNLYDRYDSTFDPIQESKLLHEISSLMLKNYQFVPLFHAAIPYLYNAQKIHVDDLNHLFILNFWKLDLK